MHTFVFFQSESFLILNNHIMESLLSLLFLATLILFIIGLFNPKKSLFWEKNERTKKKSSLIYGGLAILILIIFGQIDKTKNYGIDQNTTNTITPEPKTNVPTDETTTVIPSENNNNKAETDNTQEYTEADQKIINKIKAKVKRDYPKDYYVQKAMYDQEVDAFFYMKTVTDREVKKKVQRDYPMDFFVQKAMYDQEIDAKEQMK